MRPTDAQFEAIATCSVLDDARFWYGVATTGIYCRPSCRSKTPLRENVRIFGTPWAAEAAGFRPCKRCAPKDAESPLAETARAMERAADYLRERAADSRWQQAAELIHLSPVHFHRLFKAHFGLAPRAYLIRCRLERAQSTAPDDRSVLTRALEAGFGSPAAYYRARRRFGALREGE